MMKCMTPLEATTILYKGGKLPKGLTICGNLDLTPDSNVILPNEIELPDNLTIDGDLWVNFTNNQKWIYVKKLPKKLTIRGSLFVLGNNVPIPENTVLKDVCAYFAGDFKGKGYDYYSKSEYNDKVDEINRRVVYFLREKMICLQKLLEIPELWDEVYYANKDKIISLLNKI